MVDKIVDTLKKFSQLFSNLNAYKNCITSELFIQKMKANLSYKNKQKPDICIAADVKLLLVRKRNTVE